MSDIDKEIWRLQQEKAKQEEAKKREERNKLKDFLKTKVGKHFKVFEGAAMAGNSHWTFITIEKLEETEKGINVIGPTVSAHLEPAYLYKAHYNSSFTGKGWEVLSEGLSPSFNVCATIEVKPRDERKKPLPRTFSSARITETPLNKWYNRGIEVQWIDQFDKRFEEITQEQMDSINDCVMSVQNIVWNTMLQFYKKDYRKVWSEGEVLAINQPQRKVAIELTDFMTEALSKSGVPFNRIDMVKAFAEFLRVYKPH